MKKKVLKVTGIILSLVLVLGLMTGCGSKKTTTDKKEEKKQFKIAKKDLKIGVIHISDPSEGSGYHSNAEEAGPERQSDRAQDQYHRHRPD